MQQQQPAQLLALANAVRQVAREHILPHFLKVAHDHKSDGSLLTQADIAAHHALLMALPQLIDRPVLSEEMPHEEQLQLWQNEQAGLWVIDPIDGTSNFVNGIPAFCISVAYVVKGEATLGVIYNPVADECYAAANGVGAWLNDDALPLRTSAAALKHCIAGVDFKRLRPALASALAAQGPFHSQRNFGSSALEWCFVAAGRYDVYLHGGQMLWDFAAGQLILREAGGAYRTLEQNPADVQPGRKRSVVAAANSALLSQWHGWLAQHDESPNVS